jgi:hypothetical protein
LKEKLYRFRLPIIIVAVTAVFVTVAVIIQLAKGPKVIHEKEYFATSQYPVRCKAKSDGTLFLQLDGSATANLQWKVENHNEDLCSIEETAKEEKGILSVSVNPRVEGDATLLFTRKTKVKGQEYTVAAIHMKVENRAGKDGQLMADVSDAYQEVTSVGAVDSDTPYIIKGSRILLPGGGDWEIKESTSDGKEAANLFTLQWGTDDTGISYLEAYPAVDDTVFAEGFFDTAEGKAMEEASHNSGEKEEPAKEEDSGQKEQKTDKDADPLIESAVKQAQPIVTKESVSRARIVLKSKALKVTQMLTWRINDNGDGELQPTDE